MPSRLFYINKGPGRVSQAIGLRQSGKCRYCGKNFTTEELIVSNGKRKKYYHKECAQKLNILVSLPEGVSNKKPTSTFNIQGPAPIFLLDLKREWKRGLLNSNDRNMKHDVMKRGKFASC